MARRGRTNTGPGVRRGQCRVLRRTPVNVSQAQQQRRRRDPGHPRKLCTLNVLANALGDVSRSSIGNVVREIRSGATFERGHLVERPKTITACPTLNKIHGS